MGLELEFDNNTSPVPDYVAPDVDVLPIADAETQVSAPVEPAPAADDANELVVQPRKPYIHTDPVPATINIAMQTESDDANKPTVSEEPASPDQPIDHKTNRPALMPPRRINTTAELFRQRSFNMPIGTVFTARMGIPPDEATTEALAHQPPLAHGSDAINREGADWQQAIQHGGNYIAPVTAMPKVSVGGEVSGDAAVALLKRHSGLGVPMQVELPGSCIYLEINSIPDSDMINFHFAFATDRIRLGRDTAGMLLSTRSGVFVERLVRLILSHVTWTNVKNLEGGLVESLIRRIDVSDYQLLVNGVMAAQWPDGYPWSIRCHNPACNHEDPRSLSFPRMHYIDRSMLTDKQLDMLITKRKSISDAELEEYRNEFKLVPSSRITMEDGVVIELGRTTMSQYFENTAAWISDIESQQIKALTDYATAAERESYMSSQMQSQAMRRYRHYVKRILIPGRIPEDGTVPMTDDDYYIVTDQATITRQLTTLSTTDARSVEFEEAVLRYIEDTTVGLVAYATEICNVCKTMPVNEKGEVINTLVPLAVDKLFFTASRLKTQLLAAIDQVEQ